MLAVSKSPSYFSNSKRYLPKYCFKQEILFGTENLHKKPGEISPTLMANSDFQRRSQTKQSTLQIA